MANLSTYFLAIIGIVFILQLMTGGMDGLLTSLFIFSPTVALTQPWRFITSMFLHGGVMHILFNGYALYLFGSILERQISKRDYLIIFFGAGLLGGLFYYMTYLLGIIPPIPALGASGAIFGILGAVAMILPEMRIFFWFIPMKMKYAAVFWIALELFGSFDTSSGIASAAHLGGLLFGLGYAWYLKNRIRYDLHADPWAQ
ncbi:rhomboid family intramembrane serine protease [Candidatus Micrarchaeota archaeon]|nr:rhomboid family intramembrane serine protease [Candidatus Micrarchaeota archaeon]MBU1165400.1 rhomboid family intramembrane serine protease [Candidatus Micrarchaeota archaeon]MBU1887055.1 rhomboid family intramembrane serine protease [Candidatus Micrarchaeota archaeon]